MNHDKSTDSIPLVWEFGRNIGPRHLLFLLISAFRSERKPRPSRCNLLAEILKGCLWLPMYVDGHSPLWRNMLPAKGFVFSWFLPTKLNSLNIHAVCEGHSGLWSVSLSLVTCLTESLSESVPKICGHFLWDSKKPPSSRGSVRVSFFRVGIKITWLIYAWQPVWKALDFFSPPCRIDNPWFQVKIHLLARNCWELFHLCFYPMKLSTSHESRAGSGELPGRICWVFGPPTSPFCCGGYYLSLFTTVYFGPKLVTSVFQVEDCLLD